MARMARAVPRPLGVAAALLLAAGLGWGYPTRERGALGPLLLLFVGAGCALAACGLWVALERRPGPLRLPADLPGLAAGSRRLPGPAAWGPLLAAGLAVLAGAALVGSLPLAVLGAVILTLAAGDAARVRADARAGRAPLRRAVRDARRIRAFLDAHAGADAEASGQGADGQVEPVGRDTVRLVVVAADGWFGDLVTVSVEAAELAAALAGLTLHERLPAAVVSRIATGRYEWRRMAGLQLGG